MVVVDEHVAVGGGIGAQARLVEAIDDIHGRPVVRGDGAVGGEDERALQAVCELEQRQGNGRLRGRAFKRGDVVDRLALDLLAVVRGIMANGHSLSLPQLRECLLQRGN